MALTQQQAAGLTQRQIDAAGGLLLLPDGRILRGNVIVSAADAARSQADQARNAALAAQTGPNAVRYGQPGYVDPQLAANAAYQNALVPQAAQAPARGGQATRTAQAPVAGNVLQTPGLLEARRFLSGVDGVDMTRVDQAIASGNAQAVLDRAAAEKKTQNIDRVTQNWRTSYDQVKTAEEAKAKVDLDYTVAVGAKLQSALEKAGPDSFSEYIGRDGSYPAIDPATVTPELMASLPKGHPLANLYSNTVKSIDKEFASKQRDASRSLSAAQTRFSTVERQLLNTEGAQIPDLNASAEPAGPAKPAQPTTSILNEPRTFFGVNEASQPVNALQIAQTRPGVAVPVGAGSVSVPSVQQQNIDTRQYVVLPNGQVQYYPATANAIAAGTQDQPVTFASMADFNAAVPIFRPGVDTPGGNALVPQPGDQVAPELQQVYDAIGRPVSSQAPVPGVSSAALAAQEPLVPQPVYQYPGGILGAIERAPAIGQAIQTGASNLAASARGVADTAAAQALRAGEYILTGQARPLDQARQAVTAAPTQTDRYNRPLVGGNLFGQPLGRPAANALVPQPAQPSLVNGIRQSDLDAVSARANALVPQLVQPLVPQPVQPLVPQPVQPLVPQPARRQGRSR